MSTRRDDAAPPARSEALHVLRASAPASRWLEAYPVGNGLRGAMCAGLDGGDRLWLNDITAWSGHADADPLEDVSARGAEALAAVRAAIDAGEPDVAETLLQRMQTPWVQAYLPLGWIDIEVLRSPVGAGGDPVVERARNERDGTPRTLQRRLDLATGVATHSSDGVTHRTWADLVTGLIMHEITAEEPISVRLQVGSLLRAQSAPTAVGGDLVSQWQLPVDVAPGHEQPAEPIRYDAAGRRGAIVVRSLGAADVTDGVLTTAAAETHLFAVATATAPSLPGEPADDRDALQRAQDLLRGIPASADVATHGGGAAAPRTAPPTARSTTGARSSFRLLPARTASTPWSACGARRTQRRPLARGARLPLRAVPADRVVAAGRTPDHAAGPVERRASGSVVERLHAQHQHPDGVLAGRDDRPRRVPRAVAASSLGASPRRPAPPSRASSTAPTAGWPTTIRMPGRTPRPSAPATATPPGRTGRWVACGSRCTCGSTTRSAATGPSCATEAWPVLASAGGVRAVVDPDRRRARLDESVDLAGEPLRRRRRQRARRRGHRDDGCRAAARAGGRLPRRGRRRSGVDEPWVAELTARTGSCPTRASRQRGDLLEWDRAAPGGRAGAPASLAPHRAVPAGADHAGGHARTRARGIRVASGCAVPSRRAGRSRGARPCRRGSATAAAVHAQLRLALRPADEGAAREGQDPEGTAAAPRRALPEPLQRPPAVPDRRQPRRDRGDRGGPGAVVRRAGRGARLPGSGSTPPACGCGCCPRFRRTWPDGAVRGIRSRGDVSVDVEWAGGRLVRARLRAGAQPTTMMVHGPDGPLGTYELAPGTTRVIDAGERGTSW